MRALTLYEYNGKTWPTVIGTIAGKEAPKEIIMLIANIDSISDTSIKIAPGVDDNASGVAVLLETARILRGIPMERTVIFGISTNEERGARGSKAYAHQAKKDGFGHKGGH